MGFTTGFTGGVTLTLGVAYLTLLAHQRNRERQAAILRQQTYLLSGVVDPLPPVLPPTRLEAAVAERANFTEAVKDRWNAEIEHAVRWAQTKDWSEVREGVETAIGRLWARGFGDAQEGIEKGEQKSTTVRELTEKAKAEARERSAGVAAAAKSAYADAKAQGAELTSKAEQKAEEKASEAKGSVLGAIGRGIEKGKEVFNKTKTAVIVVEENKVEPTLSPVDKALQQRYEQPSGLDKTVEEVLASRYVPIDQKDNTDLKAL